jgi:hypothetical protein
MGRGLMSKEKPESKNISNARLNSKFWKIFLTIIAACLTFVAPTYGVYALTHVLKLDFVISMVAGSASFMIGLVLVWYLIKNKVIT